MDPLMAVPPPPLDDLGAVGTAAMISARTTLAASPPNASAGAEAAAESEAAAEAAEAAAADGEEGASLPSSRAGNSGENAVWFKETASLRTRTRAHM
jgi:hypothetical protein